jgi:hypothetical protein
MRKLMVFAVAVLTLAFMAASPALAHDLDRDGWDEDSGFWISSAVDYDDEWDDDFDGDDDFDSDDAECVVEDVDYSGVFEEWEVDLACSWE